MAPESSNFERSSRSPANEVLEALRMRAVHARELGYAVIDIAAVIVSPTELLRFLTRHCTRLR
jgi:hypothetical protein